MNVAGGDGVRLFEPDKTLAEKIVYGDAPEGLSFALDLLSNKWSYTIPTPGAANIFNVPLSGVTISELLPNPSDDDDEFVEFFNAAGAASSARRRRHLFRKCVTKDIASFLIFFNLFSNGHY